MGQKSNLNSLRNFKQNLNLISYDSKHFFNVYSFLNNLKILFEIKGVLILSNVINFLSNKVYINLKVYYRSFKTTLLLKKKKKLVKWIRPFNNFTKVFSRLFYKQFNFLKNNLVIFTITNLNKKIDKKVLLFFFSITKKFLTLIFIRRFTLFIDFIKMFTLFSEGFANTKNVLLLVNQIFKFLSKNTHKKFMFFLTSIFKEIINTKQNKGFKNKVSGVKFILKGKIRGKLRASSHIIEVGLVPTQSIEKNIQFAKITSYTLLGTFGMKLWIFTKN